MPMPRITISLTDPDMAWLTNQAKANGVSPADIIRRMITAERNKKDLAAYLMPPTERELAILEALRK